ncbi:MAG TPA: chemotaxis-specific protein-glutamate methyltransferase CheB [Kofleriaceae bacterium]|jgi:two-component system chemotaxis response regulator CheB|nr:chemotaxis-specific protein-glutamate methyltransferase CheB [Kofleriaceae bacterium]
MIRVLVVDDSLTVRSRLVELLRADPGIEVVGEAADGRRAVELCAKLKPDVVTLDIVMPDMTGLHATEHIMAHNPTPILIVSSSFNRGELFDTYAALQAGAVDVLEKPRPEDVGWEAQFVGAVRMVARIKVITHPRGRLSTRQRTVTMPPQHELTGAAATEPRELAAIALGASTGGPGALSSVLSAIAPRFTLPILVILHIDAPFATAFAEWLAQQCGHRVRLAIDGDRLVDAAGAVLVAPAERHMIVHHGRIRLVDTPPRNHCRPSIDVLFESLAAELGGSVAAALLTGMGRDGARGLLAIRAAGGITFAQDEATSTIYGMPREAVALAAVDRAHPLGEIAQTIDHLAHPPPRAKP